MTFQRLTDEHAIPRNMDRRDSGCQVRSAVENLLSCWWEVNRKYVACGHENFSRSASVGESDRDPGDAGNSIRRQPDGSQNSRM